MAKGLRSKNKRHNRAQLRTRLSKPQIEKRQQELSEALKKSLEEKNGSTVIGLKSIFPGALVPLTANKPAVMDTDGDDEEKVVVTKVAPKKKVEKPKVVKGSRARLNPKKQLSWF